MIDLHTHILPGLDDGAKTLEESLQMIRIAAQNGTRVMVATPHMMPGTYDNTIDIIQHAVNALQNAVTQHDIDMHIVAGAEVHLCPEIMFWFERDSLPFIGTYESKRVLLLELPHGHVPQGTFKLINWLLSQNILPMIAHPERNHGIWNEPNILQQLIDLGCLIQITAGSLLGEFRGSSQKIAEQLVVSGQAHVMASDAHGIRTRTPDMTSAIKRLKVLTNKNYADKVLLHLPRKILE